MIRTITLSTLSAFLIRSVQACSCFGPQTFCGTLDPQPPEFPEPEWWVPSDIVMAVVMGSEAYGVDVKVVQNWSGTLQPEEVVRVWGDCGLLCRHYVDGVPVGDTVIWALQHCDLSGNGSCGTNFESEGDYQLSICGVYWLNYANGLVSGPLTQEDVNETVTLDEFGALVQGCSITGVAERGGAEALVVRTNGPSVKVEMSGGAGSRLQVFDAQGRRLLDRGWDGTPWELGDAPAGVIFVQVTRGEQRWIKRVLVPGAMNTR